MAKKTINNLKIDHLRYPDRGIAFLDDEEIIVKHGLPGQVVEAECSRKRKQKLGRILQILERAPEEVKPSCPDFSICGGCSFLNIPYEYELQLKSEMVTHLLKNACTGNIPNSFWSSQPKIIPSPSITGYRNKMEFSFGDYSKEGGLALGIRKRNRYYEVTVPSKCALISEDFKTIVLSTLAYFRRTSETFYHRMRHTGTLRYLVLRRGEFTGELLINLVTTSALDQRHLEKWMDELLALSVDNKISGKITGILHTISDSLSDAVVPENVKELWGRRHFYEKICGLTFGISPFSFFQTNSGGAELLYRTIAEFVGQGEKVYDLYCGTGTITQVLAPHAKEVVGIELVPEAVEAAKENARTNGINNCQFIAGDVLKVLEGHVSEHTFSLSNLPDVLVLDPPRDGINPKALGKLIALGAPKIVYVSCKPTSLARDLIAFQEEGYQVTDLRFHDMFPRTPHIETVCLLERQS